jgi:nucleoside-diphosphate-sugar epimerase
MIKPNLLITGCTGFVGRNLISSDHFKDFNLYCLIRTPEQANDLKKIRNDIYFITISELDNSPTDLIFDSCIHLAAYGVNPNQINYTDFINTNIFLTLKLYEFSKKLGCKFFINVGSVFEYGEKYSNSIINETNIPLPDTMYGSSKYAAHLLLNSLHKKINLKFITIRPFGLFGKFESFNRLYPQVIISGIKNEALKLTPGNQIRNIVYVNDFVKFLKLLVVYKNEINEEVINFTNSIPMTIKEFINQIVLKLKFNPSLFQFGLIPYRKYESMVYIGENNLMNSIFKNFQFTDLNHAIEESFQYYK